MALVERKSQQKEVRDVAGDAAAKRTGSRRTEEPM